MRSVRPQTVTLIVFAILVGLAAVLVFKTYLMAPRAVVQPPPPPPDDRLGMLVWQSNLPANSKVRDSDVAILREPRSMLKPGTLFFIEQIRGKVCKTVIAAGNVVTLNDFYDMDKQKPPTLVDVLPENHRLIPLRVDDPSFSPTILLPNSYIDVLLTIDSPVNDEKMTTRLVHAIQVVSQPVTDGGVPNVVSTSRDGKVSITVAATPEDAQRLTLAQQSGGQISVALCNGPAQPGDTAVSDMDIRQLLRIPLPPQPLVPEPPVRNVVAEYHGTQVVYKVFDDNGDPVEQVDAESAARDTAIAAQRAAAGLPADANAKPPKSNCPDCDRRKREMERKAKARANGLRTPTPQPTPAPQEPLPTPVPPQTP